MGCSPSVLLDHIRDPQESRTRNTKKDQQVKTTGSQPVVNRKNSLPFTPEEETFDISHKTRSYKKKIHVTLKKSSAGRNQKFNDEQLRKIQLHQNMENVQKKMNKENVQSKNAKTGAIKKSQVQNKYPCGYDVKSLCTVSRIPLLDIRHKNVDRNKHVPEELKKADFINGNLMLNKKSLPIIPNSRSSSTICVPNRRRLNITETPTPTRTKYKNTYSTGKETKNDEFWMSFVAKPHMKVQKFAVSKQKKNETFQRPYLVEDSIPSLRKKTLEMQLSQHSGYLGVVTLDPSSNKVHPNITYAIEYLKDIIYNIIIKQESNVIKTEVFDKNISFIKTRASVINWLVKLHQHFCSSTDIFFMTVRLFDKILTIHDVEQNKFQLVAVAAYWIVEKYMNSETCITGQNLLNICKETYTLKKLLEVERNILMMIQFDVSVGEPTIFVYYYIYIMQLYESNLIAFSANYLLEILTLDLNCNSFDLSLQAASAVYLSLKLLNIKCEVWEKVENYFGYYELYEMFDVHKIMIKYLCTLLNGQCPYKQSYMKYSSEKYGKVSLLLLSKFLELCYSEEDIYQLTLT